MELRWFEDFLEIVATRNFSTAAAARNISQPAFSRRIMALESWVGIELIDRSTYPVRLTRAGTLFLPRCREIIRDIYRLRTDCLQQSDPEKKLFSFSALHTIALFFFPSWIRDVEYRHGPTHVSMHMGDFHECVEYLSLGKCDFALAYNHPDGPPVLQAGPFDSLKIGVEPLIPVSAVDAHGRPVFDLSEPGQERSGSPGRTPYLAYAWNDGYIGKLVSMILSRQHSAMPLSTVYEASVAEGIKRMAIVGKGVGWLPLSCARDAIERGELCQTGGPDLTLDMDVCIFRRQGADGPDLDQFWHQIAALSDGIDTAVSTLHLAGGPIG